MKDWIDVPGEDFDSEEARDTEMAQMMETMQERIAAVGYDLTTPQGLELGMLAYNAAFMLMDVAGVRPAKAGPTKVGRNERCPCGSGKKYKKCCLGNRVASDKVRRQIDSSLQPPVAMIPCLSDPHRLQEDLSELEYLLLDDPALRQIRLNEDRVVKHYLDNRPKELSEEPEEALEELGRLALDYAEKHDETEVLDRFHDAVFEAAGRARSMAELRALSLGHVLSMMKGESNLLATSLYRIALGDRLEQERVESELMERVKDVLLRGGIEPTADAVKKAVLEERLAEQLLAQDDGTLKGLLTATEAKLDGLRDSVCDGHFPVLAPWATVLSFFVAAVTASRHGETVDSEQMNSLLERAQAEFGEDDGRLYASLLSDWLDADDGQDADVTAKVQLMLAMAEAGSLGPLVADLIYGALTAGAPAQTEWEAELEWEEEEEEESDDDAPNFTPEFLEAYGDAMLEHGYRGIAIRTWKLCEMVGPIPESVLGKIEAAEGTAE